MDWKGAGCPLGGMPLRPPPQGHGPEYKKDRPRRRLRPCTREERRRRRNWTLNMVLKVVTEQDGSSGISLETWGMSTPSGSDHRRRTAQTPSVYRHYPRSPVDTIMVDWKRGTAEVGTSESRGVLRSDKDVPLHLYGEVSNLSYSTGGSMAVPGAAEAAGHDTRSDLSDQSQRSQLSGRLGRILPTPQGPPSNRLGESPKYASIMEGGRGTCDGHWTRSFSG